jgi:hypothetical protein
MAAWKRRDRSDIVAFLILLDDDVKVALQVMIPLDSYLGAHRPAVEWNCNPEPAFAEIRWLPVVV